MLVVLVALAGCATRSAAAGARVVTVGQSDNGHTVRRDRPHPGNQDQLR
jgi:hypothetical protein